MARKTWELSDADRDTLIRTALGEAAGEGEAGMEAVLHVILNRAESGEFASTPAGVAKQPKQFSTWNSGEGGNNPEKWKEGSKAYRAAERALDRALSSDSDPTSGALYYHTNSISPYWAESVNKNGTKQIGNHTFYPGHPVPPGNIPGVASSLDTDNVAEWQGQLAAKGFSPGAIDGKKGPKTEAAVRAFQRANGLEPDGIVGPKTLAKLAATGQARPTSQRQEGMAPVNSARPLDGPNPLVPGLASRQVRTLRVDSDGNPILPEGSFTLAPPSIPGGDILNPLMPARGGWEEHGSGRGYDPELGSGPNWSTLDVLKGISAGDYKPKAPVPMPGRPAETTEPKTSAPASSSGAMVRLASGKTIAPGVYPSSGGGSVRISDDGRGGAKIEKVRGPGAIPGVIDPIREMNSSGTLAGAAIRAKVPEAVAAGGNALMQGGGQAVEAVAQATDGLAKSAGGLWDNVMSFMGGGPATTPETKFLSLVTSPKVAPVPMPGRPASLDASRSARIARSQAEDRAGQLDAFGMIR